MPPPTTKPSPFAPLLLLFLIFSSFSVAHAQLIESDEKAILSIKKGVQLKKDSTFLMNFRFRMQNRAGFNTLSGNKFDVEKFDMRVRRLRLRMDGHVLDPKLKYSIQLAFSKSDLNLEDQDKAEPVRDAIIYYHFHENFYMGFGQSKLPGNRQRLNSSGNLQFADRSIVNSMLTLDRDFGFFGYYTLRLPESLVLLKGAVTTGDGRNASAIDDGLAYTGRVEFLPFGAFKNNGDYSEGDLEFEERPKLSVGAAFSKNFNATKTRGQLGEELFAYRDLTSLIFDVILKYQGWAFSSEYISRGAPDPITTNELGDTRFVITGHGINSQLSRLLSKNTELAVRYSFVNPNEEIRGLQNRIDESMLGVTRYINGHKIKIQAHVGYRWVEGNKNLHNPGNDWTGMLQVEFGI